MALMTGDDCSTGLVFLTAPPRSEPLMYPGLAGETGREM